MIDRNNIIFKYSYLNKDKDKDNNKDSKKSAPQNLSKLLSNTINIYTQYIDL